MELLVVLSIAVLLSGAVLWNMSGQIPIMQENKAVADLIAAIRTCRLEAVTQNEPVTWWMFNENLTWWIDSDQDGMQDASEVQTIGLEEDYYYGTYPNRGTFDGRGEHSTDIATFPGMLVWLYGDTDVKLITVSANGHVTDDNG
jgi:type II secretory pathway pseudopilin PulG